MKKIIIDKPVFITSISTLLLIFSVFMLFPSESNVLAQKLFEEILNNLGFLYTWSGVLVICGIAYFSFSHYGKIVLGDEATPEFNTLTWGALIFTAGIAAALMFWAAIEWVYYYVAPPMNIEPLSWEAAEWAGTYGIFHWGITAWSFYAICSLPIGYSYFVRKYPVLKISAACRSVLGDNYNRWPGKIIDILFIISLALGSATSLSVGVPIVSAAICEILNIGPSSVIIDLIVLTITTLIFGITGFFGLKKGIAKLSNISSYLTLLILVLVLIFGPTLFIIKMTTTSIGLLANNFIRMSTWMDPINNNGFPESWTQFYWAWWISYSPFMGLFIARISKGRSIKNMLLGSVAFGSLGCSFFFWILGNFQLDLQISGKLDIVNLVDTIGPSATIIKGFNQLPVGKIVILLYAICGILFLATTFNSVSFTFASVSMKELKQDQDPNKYLVLFWAILLALIPAAFLGLNGPLSTLQSVTVLGSFPLILVIILEIWAFVKMVKEDSKANNY